MPRCPAAPHRRGRTGQRHGVTGGGALRHRSPHETGLGVVAGIIGVVVGTAALIHPFAGVAARTFLIGIWPALRGTIEFVAGIRGPAGGRSRVWLVVSAVLWILGGVLFMVNPGIGALTITLWLGVFAIAWGGALIGADFVLRSQCRAVERADASASGSGR
ncbi:MAG TPA: hypothetical protein DDY46_06000 [Kocuria sp.]|nr:hypothetical protein [Kocuria sp.]